MSFNLNVLQSGGIALTFSMFAQMQESMARLQMAEIELNKLTMKGIQGTNEAALHMKEQQAADQRKQGYIALGKGAAEMGVTIAATGIGEKMAKGDTMKGDSLANDAKIARAGAPSGKATFEEVIPNKIPTLTGERAVIGRTNDEIELQTVTRKETQIAPDKDRAIELERDSQREYEGAQNKRNMANNFGSAARAFTGSFFDFGTSRVQAQVIVDEGQASYIQGLSGMLQQYEKQIGDAQSLYQGNQEKANQAFATMIQLSGAV